VAAVSARVDVQRLSDTTDAAQQNILGLVDDTRVV
jgi:hypothetical protein